MPNLKLIPENGWKNRPMIDWVVSSLIKHWPVENVARKSLAYCQDMSRSRASRIKGRQLWSKAWCYKSGSKAANPESAESAESEAQVISNIPKPGHIWTHDLQSLGGKICPRDVSAVHLCNTAQPSFLRGDSMQLDYILVDDLTNMKTYGKPMKTYGNLKLKLWLWTFHTEILPVCVYPCFPFLFSFPFCLPYPEDWMLQLYDDCGKTDSLGRPCIMGPGLKVSARFREPYLSRNSS